jgi:GTPase SAR1 family protein
MGACASNVKVSTIQAEIDREITKQLSQERRKLEEEIKLLLLGSGEAGKSTLSKQMRILFLNGFTTEERLSFRVPIYDNILSSARVLITAAVQLKLELSADLKKGAENLLDSQYESIYTITNPTPEVHFITDLLPLIQKIWKDPSIQAAYSQLLLPKKDFAEFQTSLHLPDSAKYFLDNLGRVAEENYTPNETDVLKCRCRTTGIIETEFEYEDVRYRLVDVGGQRSERRKWLNCFQDVHATLFCASLSEYDQVLFEDESMNRTKESLRLWKEVCNNKWFARSSFVLFLNKSDLLREKIENETEVDGKSRLSLTFPDYSGPPRNYDAALAFLREKYLEQSQSISVASAMNPHPKTIYVHITCATDTNQMHLVFHDIRQSIVKEALAKSDIL